MTTFKPSISQIVFTLAFAFAGASAWAQHGDKEIAEDIERHLAMAKAHQNAAQCLKDGKDDKTCHAQLQKDCKGLAIGKTCGMRHEHKH